MSRIIPSSTIFPDYYIVRNSYGQVRFGTSSHRRPCRTCGGAGHHEARIQWGVGKCRCSRKAVPARFYPKRTRRVAGK